MTCIPKLLLKRWMDLVRYCFLNEIISNVEFEYINGNSNEGYN